MKLSFDIPQKNRFRTLTATIERLTSQWKFTFNATIRSAGGTNYSGSVSFTSSVNANEGVTDTLKTIAARTVEGDMSGAGRIFAEMMAVFSNRSLDRPVALRNAGSGLVLVMRPLNDVQFDIVGDVDDIEVY